jgi:hypothetical protein
MAEFFSGKSPPADGSIRMRESDGSPDIASVSDLIISVPDLILTDNGGGTATLTASSGAGGTVTSVDLSGGLTGLTATGGPITTSGTITLGGTLAIGSGGTGVTGTPTNGQLLIGNGTGYTLSTLTAGTGVTITNGAGSVTIAAATSDVPLLKTTGSYSAGVSTDIDFTIPTGTNANVAFQITVYLEDSVTADSAMVTFDGILVRSTGAPLAPTFAFVVVPGTDGGALALGTGGANTLRVTLTTPAGSGSYVASVRLTED